MRRRRRLRRGTTAARSSTRPRPPSTSASRVPTIDAPLDHVGVPPDPDGGVCQRELRAVVRDFRSGEKDGQPKHPDFENKVAIDPGIVATMLGSDPEAGLRGRDDRGRPRRRRTSISGTATCPASTSPSKRPSRCRPIRRAPASGSTTATRSIRSANDEGWGNQYLDHNQDFTTEIHVSFPYKGGEVFTFRGDDDLFLFVNGRLAVDLGGVHDALTGHRRSGRARRRAGPTGREDVSDGHLPGRTPLLPVDLPHRDDVVLHQQHHRRVIIGYPPGGVRK